VGDVYTSITKNDGATYGLNKTKSEINFNDPAWTSTTAKSATCAKSLWAQQQSILWDGISNFNGNCK
jgi:hypothetical protein